MSEKERKTLRYTLENLTIGSIIKVIFSDKEEVYIVNDKNNFCELKIVDYGVIINKESSMDHILSYFCNKEVKNIEQFSGKELSSIKTLLLEILFGISKYETDNIHEKEITDKVNKLKKILY